MLERARGKPTAKREPILEDIAAGYIEERFLDCARRRLSQEARQTEEKTGALRSLPASGQAE